MSSIKHVTRNVTPANILKDIGFSARQWVGTPLYLVMDYVGQLAADETGAGTASDWKPFLFLEVEAQIVTAGERYMRQAQGEEFESN